MPPARPVCSELRRFNHTSPHPHPLKCLLEARKLGLAVEQLPKRRKGSHTIWVVLDDDGKEVGRLGLTGHAGQQSQTVTRSNEEALEALFGEGWLDR